MKHALPNHDVASDVLVKRSSQAHGESGHASANADSSSNVPVGEGPESVHRSNWAPMPELDAIVHHPLYVAAMGALDQAERNREFCRHGFDHLSDVARLAWIETLEHGLHFRRSVVYAAAYLHDVGKARQYETGDPHEVVGAQIAWQILQDVEGFSELEKNVIVSAVGQHRHYSDAATPLGRILYIADNASRPCWRCDARDRCSWPEEKMNLDLRI